MPHTDRIISKNYTGNYLSLHHLWPPSTSPTFLTPSVISGLTYTMLFLRHGLPHALVPTQGTRLLVSPRPLPPLDCLPPSRHSAFPDPLQASPALPARHHHLSFVTLLALWTPLCSRTPSPLLQTAPLPHLQGPGSVPLLPGFSTAYLAKGLSCDLSHLTFLQPPSGSRPAELRGLLCHAPSLPSLTH